jgi:hypothetical protein
VEGLATRNYLTMTRIPMIEFKQNVELLILTNYFLNAALLSFSPLTQTATMKKSHCGDAVAFVGACAGFSARTRQSG